jgi:antitoxin VapB
MQLYINNERALQLAKELAELTGESMTEAVIHTLEQRLAEERAKPRKSAGEKRRAAETLVAEIRHLPVYDDRHPDEMLYDKDGLPKAQSAC